jgi:hypothetical protein
VTSEEWLREALRQCIVEHRADARRCRTSYTSETHPKLVHAMLLAEAHEDAADCYERKLARLLPEVPK